MCASYAFNEGVVKTWQPLIEHPPVELMEAFNDPFVKILAWNSQFERLITKWVLGIELPYTRFLDPMINARYLSLPGSLDECCEMLGLSPDTAKLSSGKRLLKMFSLPASMGGEETLFGISQPVYRDWNSHPREWRELLEYNARDVIAEREIWNRMEKYRLPDHELETFYLDQLINDRGIFVDTELTEGAVKLSDRIKGELTERLFKLTGLANPNSRDQMLEWCRNQGYPYHGLGKSFVNQALAGNEITPACREALTIRKQAAKTTDSKFDAILKQLSSDSRLRNQYSFMGASRTGRWSSGGSQ